MEQFIASIFNKAHGVETHYPIAGSILLLEDGTEKLALCQHCSKQIRSFYRDDEDREGWSEWK